MVQIVVKKHFDVNNIPLMNKNKRNSGFVFSAGILKEYMIKDYSKKMHEPKSGRVYVIKGRRHVASAPDEVPANLTGETLYQIRTKSISSLSEVRIIDASEYAISLSRKRSMHFNYMYTKQGEYFEVFRKALLSKIYK